MFHVKQTELLKQNVSRETDFEGNPGADVILNILFHVKHKTAQADKTTFTPSLLFHVKQFEKQIFQKGFKNHTSKRAAKTTEQFHVKQIQNPNFQNNKHNVSRETKINHRNAKQKRCSPEKISF